MSSLSKLSEFLFCSSNSHKNSKYASKIDITWPQEQQFTFTKIQHIDDPQKHIPKIAKEFGIPHTKVRYNILQHGSKGFLGIGARPYQVLFYYIGDPSFLSCPLQGKFYNNSASSLSSMHHKIKLKIRKQGIFIKLIPESDGSLSFSLDRLVSFLSAKGISYSLRRLNEIFATKLNHWEKLAEYQGDQNDNSQLVLEISEDKTQAHLLITKPIKLGALPELEEIVQKLKENEVIFGIKWDVIGWMLKTPVLDNSICIAEGVPCIPSIQPRIQFFFDLDNTKIKVFPKNNGKTNFFGNTGFVNNVLEDMVLAEKVEGKDGKSGIGIDNQPIFPEKIKEISFEPGKNATLSPDGKKIIASISGRPFYKSGEIGVTPSLCVDNVNLETGSIVFLGDVVVRGSVEDGFSINAEGNVYVYKYVGKSKIESQGDILIKGGFLGRDEGEIRSDGNVVTRFINKGKVRARGIVIAYDGAFYSDVESDAFYALGPYGRITGGSIRCRKEVNVQAIGSSTYTSTKIEIGSDPQAKERLSMLNRIYTDLKDNYKKVVLNVDCLEKKMQYKKNLDKMNSLYQRLVFYKNQIQEQINIVSQDIAQIKSYVSNLNTKNVRIAAKQSIYPGTEIRIHKSSLLIKQEFNFACFYKKIDEPIQNISYIEPAESVFVFK